MSVLVTVITSTFNAEYSVQKMLNSLQTQTFEDYEHVIVDGASSDGTLGILTDYAKNDKRVKLVSEPDDGIYNAWNKALKIAKGEWILFLSADDYFVNNNALNFFSNQLRKVESAVEIVYGNLNKVTELGVLVKTKKDSPQKKGTFTQRRPWTPPHRSTFHRASVFKKYLYDETYGICADDKLFLILMNESEIVHIDRVLVCASFGGISDTKALTNYFEAIRLAKELNIKYPILIRIDFFVRSALKTIVYRCVGAKVAQRLLDIKR